MTEAEPEPVAEPPAERPFPERVQKIIDAHQARQKQEKEKREQTASPKGEES